MGVDVDVLRRDRLRGSFCHGFAAIAYRERENATVGKGSGAASIDHLSEVCEHIRAQTRGRAPLGVRHDEADSEVGTFGSDDAIAFDPFPMELVMAGGGMAARTEDLVRPPALDGVEFRRVDGPNGIEDWARVARQVWDEPDDQPGLVDRFAAVLHEVDWSTSVTLEVRLAYVAAQPVAMASALSSASTINIEHVGVVPEFRRRGLGAAITFAPIDNATASIDGAVIGPDDESWRLYQRLGFRAFDDTAARFGVITPRQTSPAE